MHSVRRDIRKDADPLNIAWRECTRGQGTHRANIPGSRCHCRPIGLMPMLKRRRPVSVSSASIRKLPEYTKEKPYTSPLVSLGGPLQTAASYKNSRISDVDEEKTVERARMLHKQKWLCALYVANASTMDMCYIQRTCEGVVHVPGDAAHGAQTECAVLQLHLAHVPLARPAETEESTSVQVRCCSYSQHSAVETTWADIISTATAYCHTCR
jgi:hypothetical protein